MWLIRIALSRPYTFIVLAIMILLIGVLSIIRTSTDIFPSIRIPVISVIWSYSGLPPDEMANRITSVFERSVTTTVNDIEHIESDSLIGVCTIKLFFHPNVHVAMALSEVTAIAQTALKLLPPGTLPPLVLTYDASTVPILQVILSSNTMSEQTLNDIGNNFIRTQLATVQGAALPSPYGGKVRQISVDPNIQAMQTYRLSPNDITTTLNKQSLIIPAGTQKIGLYEYIVKLNSSPSSVEELNAIPLKATPSQVLYMRDVAHIRDGFAPQTNIVRVDGKRAVMMSILKTGGASTLQIVDRVKSVLHQVQASFPPALKLSFFADQSIFVRAAMKSVLTETGMAALLTSCMILLFLGSWKSTNIILISIPLSMLSSLSMLSMLGETINIMTLGGLALAVGILVDDATVTIENINWHLEHGKEITQAILDGADQIAIPAFVSTLCICIVFIPMFFLGGVAQYLFVPFAEAVIFAMLASYFLSRTLVPTLAHYWLQPRKDIVVSSPYSLAYIHEVFEEHFERFRQYYEARLTKILKTPEAFIRHFMSFVLCSFILFPFIGSDFFPHVDAGQIKLHIRGPTGTRVEETARTIDQIDTMIRRIIPAKELNTIVDNIGLPVSGINLSYNNSSTAGPEDADILISLYSKHHPIQNYIAKLREQLRIHFPSIVFTFLPADIVNQILNFGSPSVINLKILGWDIEKNKPFAYYMMDQIKHIPGITDVYIKQAFNYPELLVNINRSRAAEFGFTQQDIASSLLIALSGSFQTTPNFWLDLKTGVSYPIVVQVPQYVFFRDATQHPNHRTRY